MKIKSYIENLFAMAVALEQNSRAKNMICCGKNQIIIVNSDSTLLIKFEIPESIFPDDMSFYANDYDSSSFEEAEGRIIFLNSNEEYERKKVCKVPEEINFKRMNLLYKKLHNEMTAGNEISVTSSIKEMLEEGLSHIEIVFDKEGYEIIQRDIFTGNLINIKKKTEKGIFNTNKDKVNKKLSVIGLRTEDFLGLFSFSNKIDFNIFGNGYAFFKGNKNKMTGFIATCLYDDLGTINYLNKEKR